MRHPSEGKEIHHILRRTFELDNLDHLTGSCRTLLDQSGVADTIREYISLFNHLLTFHCGSEEILFHALEETGIRKDRGPLLLLREEHEEMLIHLSKMKPYLDAGGAADPHLRKETVLFSHLMWEHLDKEDSVLFSEIFRRIRGDVRKQFLKSLHAYVSSRHIPSRITDRISVMIKRFPPAEPDVVRGGGCIQCRHFTLRCEGMEYEWWTEEDWSDTFSRMQSE